MFYALLHFGVQSYYFFEISGFETTFAKTHSFTVIMRKVLILVFCFISTLFAWANDGVFFTKGNQLIPISETDISVKKEVLTLNRVDEKIQVTVYYEFFNPADQKEVLVGFEAAAPDTYFNDQSVSQFPLHPYISNFKVVLNGEPLSFEVAHVARYDKDWNYIPDPQYYVDGRIKSATTEELVLDDWLNHTGNEEAVEHPLYVYHFKALFRPGLNIIQHTYDFDMSYEQNGCTKDFFYVLTAANRWANNQIDDFTLYVNMADYTSFHISSGGVKSADEWEIQGTGRYSIGKLPYQFGQECSQSVVQVFPRQQDFRMFPAFVLSTRCRHRRKWLLSCWHYVAQAYESLVPR